MSFLHIPLFLLPFAMAATPAPESLPQVDFSKMGTVGLGGSFAGLDWYSGQSSSSSSPSFSSDGDTVFVRLENGSYRPLGNTNPGGQIHALCWSNSGGGNGTLFVGGSFDSVGGTSAANLAAYSLASSSSSFASLGSGVSGQVSTLFCDNENSEVWVGGEFTAPIGQGGNVGRWSTGSSSWVDIPFGGLNGAISTIAPSGNGSSIYFGGHFTTSFASNSSLVNNSTTTGNITSVPSAPDGTATTGDSGYLTPVTVPYSANQDPFVQISISASPSTSQRLYSDPNVMVCPGQPLWLAQDNTAATVEIDGVNYLRANGIRLVNGLVQGRGTKTFSFTSLPDNTLVTLSYTDPTTKQEATCTDSCPLYTDSSITGQDFLFAAGPRDLVGLQMQLKEWIGSGAGLSSVQLLSDGAYGSAVPDTNKPLCPGNLPSSSAQTSGEWTVGQHITRNPTINSYYLSSTVSTSSDDHPSVTFYPYVSASGIYELYMNVPGCADLGDCSGRTSVDIEIYPVQGGLGFSASLSQQVQDNTRTLIYTGPVDGSSGNFTPTVVLALSESPAAPASGNQYVVVADSVDLVLIGTSSSANSTSRLGGSIANGTSTSNVTMRGEASVSFGLFEYVRTSNNTLNAANAVLDNATETAVSRLGMALDAAYNATNTPRDWSVNVIAVLDNILYIGGDFAVSSNYSNIVSLDLGSGQIVPLGNMGLNGAVNTLSVLGGSIYVGGEFTSTASGGTRMDRLARWNPSDKTWSAVGDGVNGYVTDLATSPTSGSQLVVVGNFSSTLGSGGSSTSTGGYAVYDTSSSAWIPNGLLFGNLSIVATGTASKDTYLAGKVFGSSLNAVNGVALLRTGNGGAPEIATLNNVNFGPTGSAPASTSSPSRRSIVRSALARDFLSRFTDSFPSRHHHLLSARATPPTISSLPAPAPAVLTGAFWQNSSSEITVLGGNFTSTNGTRDIAGIAFYQDGEPLTGPEPPVQGVVRALNVRDNTLYIGGQNLNVSSVGTGLLVYNLATSSWVTGGVSTLSSSGGDDLIVNAIRTRGDTDTVVVAGNFANAGSLSCPAVCLWDVSNTQWSTPGPGLSAGEVKAVDFAGDNADVLVAAGSFSLSNGDVAYVATYSFANSTWTALGSLPGPALAVAVNDKNASNIFAAGYASDGTPYLQAWNGAGWSEQNSTLLPGSLIQQLAFVPMYAEHDPVGAIEGNRMLMVSGNLYLEDQGNVTSALYDGGAMHPYLVGTTSNGGLGTGSQLFWSDNSFSFSVQRFLARGLVVLVAIAIATGLILLLVLIFLLIACCNRRRERNKPPAREMYEKDGNSDVSSTHQNVFNNVQAALEQSLVGAGVGAGMAGAGAGAARYRGSDPSEYPAGEEEEDEEGRETTMRYDFEGPELQPGEMSMKAGQRVLVLDDMQSDEWWYARDPATGREGVVPATYVW